MWLWMSLFGWLDVFVCVPEDVAAWLTAYGCGCGCLAGWMFVPACLAVSEDVAV